MKSKAHFKGHPIHPILICFPIAFFTGTVIFDLLALRNIELMNIARYLTIAGLIGGVLAAVPGIIDFIYTVPPESSAKKRGAKHGILNSTVLLLFGIALYYRTQAESPDQYIILGLEIGGEILMFFAGWMGGTLVYRNQIGVDPRYADAGKWREDYADEINGLVSIDESKPLKENQMRLVHVGKRRIVIGRSETGYVAFDDYCTHRGGSLASGAMMCDTVQCPWHGSQFNVKTGEVKAGPAKENIRTYRVEENEGRLIISLR